MIIFNKVEIDSGGCSGNKNFLCSSSPTPNISLARCNVTLITNLKHAFLSTKHQLPVMMVAGGFMINASSFVSYAIGIPQITIYACYRYVD